MALQSYKTTIKKPPEMNPEGFYSKKFLIGIERGLRINVLYPNKTLLEVSPYSNFFLEHVNN